MERINTARKLTYGEDAVSPEADFSPGGISDNAYPHFAMTMSWYSAVPSCTTMPTPIPQGRTNDS